MRRGRGIFDANCFRLAGSKHGRCRCGTVRRDFVLPRALCSKMNPASRKCSTLSDLTRIPVIILQCCSEVYGVVNSFVFFFLYTYICEHNIPAQFQRIRTRIALWCSVYIYIPINDYSANPLFHFNGTALNKWA